MDPTQEDTISVDLSDLTTEFANVTIGSGIQTTYTLSNLDPITTSISISPSWLSNGTSGGYNWSNISEPPSGKLTLQGPNADIEVNGESLMSAIRKIEERLNILKPNEKLEAEWDQLRELGEQYRRLEADLLEKQKVWDLLKK